MKNKLYILVFIICIIPIIILFPKYKTAYSGTYYASGVNEDLILNSDNTFDLNVISFKNSITFSGTYRISNNQIELLPNDKSGMLFINNITNGEIIGSVITFKPAINSSATIFTKA
ncbi:MAG TPA: hypothetical protein VIK72_01880 [Clostridiaceae bacterium]